MYLLSPIEPLITGESRGENQQEPRASSGLSANLIGGQRRHRQGRHARERVRQEKGKCEGRKPHGELRPEAVALAKRLHRASPKTGRRMSLRKIAAALAEAGHLNERGQPFNPKSIVAMVAQKT